MPHLEPEQFRSLHAANPEPCCDGCKGWCVSEGSDGTTRIERCDACWAGYREVYDEDAANLPEARAELRLATGPSARWHEDLAAALVVMWTRLAEPHPRLAARLREQACRHQLQARRVRTYVMHGEVI